MLEVVWGLWGRGRQREGKVICKDRWMERSLNMSHPPAHLWFPPVSPACVLLNSGATMHLSWLLQSIPDRPLFKDAVLCHSLGSFAPPAYSAPQELFPGYVFAQDHSFTCVAFLSCPSLWCDYWISSLLLDEKGCSWGVHCSHCSAASSDRWLKTLAESTFFESCPPSVWSQPSVLLVAWFAITFGAIVFLFLKLFLVARMH